MYFIHKQEKIPGIKEWKTDEIRDTTSECMRTFFQRLGRSFWKGKIDIQIDVDALLAKRQPSELLRLIVDAMMQGGYTFAKAGLTPMERDIPFPVRDSLIAYPECRI